jgi:fructuronate reductase
MSEVGLERPRLGTARLAVLAPEIARPAYRRPATAGVLHVGAGAFHRCHQADYADDLLGQDVEGCAITAVNLRPPDLATMLAPQDHLYCRELRDGDRTDRRVIGAIVAAMTVADAATDPARATLAGALAIAADPQIRVISCTVTEKGYCHVPATGALDPDHPDIRHDIAVPDAPVSLPGFLLAALTRRLDRGVPLPVLMSCDNVPGNGATLRRCLLSLAERVRPALVERLAREALVADTMVDRIVPATREEDIAAFAGDCGVEDRALVVGEPFRMWVIDDRARDRLPPWDRAGAIFTDRVADYETLKMRVVNGMQSNLCQLGFLASMRFMADVMADPLFAAFARRAVDREVTPHLPGVPGIDLAAYVERTVERLRNPALRHECAQISTDGSRKIRQRLVEPILDAHAAGRAAPCLMTGLAGWLHYASGRSLDGGRHAVSDPLAETIAAVARATGDDAGAYVRRVVAIDSVFPARFAGDDALVGALVDAFASLRARGVHGHLRTVLA